MHLFFLINPESDQMYRQGILYSSAIVAYPVQCSNPLYVLPMHTEHQ